MADTKQNTAPIEEEKLNDQMKVRREKMQQFIDAGIYPFGQKYNWDHHAQDVKDDRQNTGKRSDLCQRCRTPDGDPPPWQDRILRAPRHYR
jgi:lysyl-tRNA synthetase class II